MIEFKEFPKMARLSREIIITEKIDGTNGCIFISEDMNGFLVGSRNRWITPEDDNAGFARWAYLNKEQLLQLGPGTHFGEWWGSGIQRGYGLTKGDKRFSLFNVNRWCAFGETPKIRSSANASIVQYQEVLPQCCHVVPILFQGDFDTQNINVTLENLKSNGSSASPGFMRPEGIVVFHTAANFGFKKTIEKDDVPKSLIKT